MNALSAIKTFKEGDLSVLKEEKWLLFIGLNNEVNVNFERINSLSEMKNNYVLDYVEREFEILEKCDLPEKLKMFVEETLKWTEVAKGGLPHKRVEWKNKGYNLIAHNIGSSQIYREESKDKDKIVDILIFTHGLIGQYIRGEIKLMDNSPLWELVKEGLLTKEELREVLKVLNLCVISGVSISLWTEVKSKVDEVIELIIEGQFNKEYSIQEKLKALRSVSIKNGENFQEEFDKYFSEGKNVNLFGDIFSKVDLWYVEAALYDFSFEEFIKIFTIIRSSAEFEKVKHISFSEFMKEIYYEHAGKKRVNIYKKRIIEKYLSELSVEDIVNNNYRTNLHVCHEIFVNDELDDTLLFSFKFSSASNKLIDFCMEAEKSDVLYEKAIILLFDLFGLRKDKFDRFYEEEAYLKTMNQSIDYKKVILDFITGDTIIDIGPGGGALMDLIEVKFPGKAIKGVDVSQNVIEALQKKKYMEKHDWDVLYGDALNLSDYIPKGSVNTIIFCSILHELFSYIEYEGKKFNYETLTRALKSAFEVLAEGGRIIIRDGIMTEAKEERRIIKFLSEEGMEFLKNYALDFKGREIQYDIIGQNEVCLNINDAMEFLYTYTWGEKSYVHEINEQFGYFTPSGFEEFIKVQLGEGVKVIEARHFLQEGYSIALSQKIEIYDAKRNSVPLPDSTCLIVIEKIKK